MRFTSRPERQLWALVMVTIVSIYATLGVARDLFEWLRERSLLRVATSVQV